MNPPIVHPAECGGVHHHLPDEGGYVCSAYPDAVYIGIAPAPYRESVWPDDELTYLARTARSAREWGEYARADFCDRARAAVSLEWNGPPARAQVAP